MTTHARFIGGPRDGERHELLDVPRTLIFDAATLTDAVAGVRSDPIVYVRREKDEDGEAVYDYNFTATRNRREPPPQPPSAE